MANLVRLAAQLRYHLSELGARNAHHEFEHLVRHLARARLYSNILPATGPVSAGGDGGRDFETFKTDIALPIVGSSFHAFSSGRRIIVFACSLEKRIQTKICTDVDKIISNGKADEIVYFCEANVAIAKRQALVTAANDRGVELQIFDGNAIAEWLAEPDLFWIAEEFLHVPAEIGPKMRTHDGYAVHKDNWEGRTPLPFSRADFVSIKAGLRHATFEVGARPDLSFWLEKMACFLAPTAPRDMVRSASYEVTVAHLRARGDITTQAALVADYFMDVDAHLDIGDLTTAATLLNYVTGGYWLGQFHVDDSDLYNYRRRLADAVQSALNEAVGPGRRAGLLYVQGLIEQTPPDRGLPHNYSAVVESWSAMLDNADKAPLYPIEAFADLLVDIIRIRGNDSDLLSLARRADDLLSKRMGGVVAGEKAIDRALSLLERHDAVAAVRELQRAKLKWFSGERLLGAARILLLLAEQYLQHGLAYAAKYHVMTVALLSRYEHDDDIRRLQPEALLDLLEAEDAAGNSFAFIQLLPVFLQAHIFFDDQPLDTEQHPRLRINLEHLAALLGFLKRGSPKAREAVDELLGEWPPELCNAIINAADQPEGFWNRGSWPEAWTALENTLLDRPFGDLGVERRVRWEGLGLCWNCIFSNDYRTAPAAEQIIAELQLIVFALAERDLGIVPVDISLTIELSDASGSFSIQVSATSKAAFRVTLPPKDRGPDDIGDSILIFIAILRACSILEDEALTKLFDISVFETVFVGRPYAELFREFIPEEHFFERIRLSTATLDSHRPFLSKTGRRVQWFDGPGPAYTSERALGDAQNRYEKILPSLRFTISNIALDPIVRPMLVEMRDRGMKDWEILSILSNIAMGVRLGAFEDLHPDEVKDRGMALLMMVETESDAISPSIFTGALLEMHSELYLRAFLDSWQLQWPSIVDYKGMEKFLVARFGLREIDVPHDDLFYWADAPANS